MLDNKSAGAIAQMLKNNKALTSITLKNCRYSYANVKIIIEALKTNKTLTSLALPNNNIDHDGINLIAGNLENNKTLRFIDLKANNINVNVLHFDFNMTKEGAQAVANLIKANSSLTSIDLGRNQLKDDVFGIIVNALKKNKIITSLALFTAYDRSENKSKITDLLNRNFKEQIKSIFCRFYYCYNPIMSETEEIGIANDILKNSLEIHGNPFIDSSPDKIKTILSLCQSLSFLLERHMFLVEKKQQKADLNLKVLDSVDADAWLSLLLQLFCCYGRIDKLDDLYNLLENFQSGVTQTLIESTYFSNVAENTSTVALYLWAIENKLPIDKLEKLFILMDKRRELDESLSDFLARKDENIILFKDSNSDDDRIENVLEAVEQDTMSFWGVNISSNRYTLQSTLYSQPINSSASPYSNEEGSKTSLPAQLFN